MTNKTQTQTLKIGDKVLVSETVTSSQRSVRFGFLDRYMGYLLGKTTVIKDIVERDAGVKQYILKDDFYCWHESMLTKVQDKNIAGHYMLLKHDRYSVGDKVYIYSDGSQLENFNKNGMTKYLSTEMTIASVHSENSAKKLQVHYAMEEDGGMWYWGNYHIEGIKVNVTHLENVNIEGAKLYMVDNFGVGDVKNGELFTYSSDMYLDNKAIVGLSDIDFVSEFKNYWLYKTSETLNKYNKEIDACLV